MSRPDSSGLETIFRGIVAWRWGLVAAYALLLPPGILLALRVETDNSISRLVVQTDSDFQDNQAFQKLFPEGEHALLLAEAPDPFAPAVLRQVAEIEERLKGVDRKSTRLNSSHVSISY